jgi:hypothetical protein
MKIDKDDFELWLAHPVTEAVLMRIKQIGDEAQAEWARMSWAGAIDREAWQYLRGRSDLASDLSEMTFQKLETDENDQSERHSTD